VLYEWRRNSKSQASYWTLFPTNWPPSSTYRFELPGVFMIWIETDFQLFPPFVTSPLSTTCISVHTCLYFLHVHSSLTTTNLDLINPLQQQKSCCAAAGTHLRSTCKGPYHLGASLQKDLHRVPCTPHQQQCSDRWSSHQNGRWFWDPVWCKLVYLAVLY